MAAPTAASNLRAHGMDIGQPIRCAQCVKGLSCTSRVGAPEGRRSSLGSPSKYIRFLPGRAHILWMDEIHFAPHSKFRMTILLEIPNNVFSWFQTGAGFRPSTVLVSRLFFVFLWYTRHLEGRPMAPCGLLPHDRCPTPCRYVPGERVLSRH